jgi:hypothetical protein
MRLIANSAGEDMNVRRKIVFRFPGKRSLEIGLGNSQAFGFRKFGFYICRSRQSQTNGQLFEREKFSCIEIHTSGMRPGIGIHSRSRLMMKAN